PLFAKGEMAHLRVSVAAGVGDQAIREMVLVVILGAGGIDLGEQGRAAVDILAGRRADGCAVVVLGDDFGAGENVNGGRAAGDLFHAQTVAVVGICAGGAAVVGADGAVFRVIDERIRAIVGHIAAEVVRIGRAGNLVRRGGDVHRIRRTSDPSAARIDTLRGAVAVSVISFGEAPGSIVARARRYGTG